LAAIAGLACSSDRARAADGNGCEREMAHAASASQIPISVLYAVALTETGSRGGFNPYDLDIDGRAVHPASLSDALDDVARERARGAKFIDVGCMQINVEFHRRDFPSLAAMFEPSANVAYAARFLAQLKREQGSWTLAVARYNSGPKNDAGQKRYVCAVIRNLVASGLGRWTPAAQAFCG
jgi:hypothetical protein